MTSQRAEQWPCPLLQVSVVPRNSFSFAKCFFPSTCLCLVGFSSSSLVHPRRPLSHGGSRSTCNTSGRQRGVIQCFFLWPRVSGAAQTSSVARPNSSSSGTLLMLFTCNTATKAAALQRGWGGSRGLACAGGAQIIDGLMTTMAKQENGEH